MLEYMPALAHRYMRADQRIFKSYAKGRMNMSITAYTRKVVLVMKRLPIFNLNYPNQFTSIMIGTTTRCSIGRSYSYFYKIYSGWTNVSFQYLPHLRCSLNSSWFDYCRMIIHVKLVKRICRKTGNECY